MNSTSSAVTCHSNAAVVPPRSGSYPLCHVSRIYVRLDLAVLLVRGHHSYGSAAKRSAAKRAVLLSVAVVTYCASSRAAARWRSGRVGG